MSEIIICGLSPSRKEVDHENTEAVIYGLPWDQLSHRYDVLFEMHDRSLWERRGEDYVQSLRDLDCPVIMQEEHAEIEFSMQYPQQLLEPRWDYYNSSIAYMLSYAITNDPDKISIYGVDNHTDEEWFFERGSNEFWIGVAKALNIEVWIHPTSSLMKFSPDVMYLTERVHYGKRYGYLPEVEAKEGSGDEVEAGGASEPGGESELGVGERGVQAG